MIKKDDTEFIYEARNKAAEEKMRSKALSTLLLSAEPKTGNGFSWVYGKGKSVTRTHSSDADDL